MSPHGILVHRDYERDMVKIKVLKVKFSHLGENRAFVWYKWNRLNGRYSEYDYQSENPEMCSGINEDCENWIVQSENNTKQETIDFWDNPSNTVQFKPNVNFYENDKEGEYIPF